MQSNEAQQTTPTLWTAAAMGEVRTLRKLLDRGASVDSTNGEGFTPLICASLAGHSKVVKLLMERGANIGYATARSFMQLGKFALLNNANTLGNFDVAELGFTALTAASQNGHLEVVKLLLSNEGGPIDLTKDFTSLFAAAQKGHLNIVKLLLDKGASIDSRIYGFTPLNVAVRNGYLEVVRLLFDRGAKVDKALTSFSSLYFGCLNRHIDIVRLLLDRGVNINSVDDDSNTALHIASSEGFVELVQLLLTRGAKIDEENRRHYSPLMEAVDSGHMEVIKLLVENGADLHKVDDKRDSPLIIAAALGNVAIAKLLLELGAHVDGVGPAKVSPLMVAASQGCLEIVKLLVSRGANVQAADTKGSTSLHLASHKGHNAIVKFLLDSGASVDALDDYHEPSLITACMAGHLDIVTLLLERGAFVDTQETDGRTALSCSAYKGHLDIVKLLVQHGAKTTAGPGGYNALNIALLHSRLDVVAYLLEIATWEASLCKRALELGVRLDNFNIADIIVNKYPQICKDQPYVVYYAARSIDSRSLAIMNALIENGAPVDSLTTDSGDKTALHVAVTTKQSLKVWKLMLYGADTTIPHSDVYGNKTTVWKLCDKDDIATYDAIYQALLHFWTPQTHKHHPQWVRDGVICTLLAAKRQQWPFDTTLMRKILSYIAYGWYTKPVSKEEGSESVTKRRKITHENQ